MGPDWRARDEAAEGMCGWWIRWWHHRKRIVDATSVIEAIINRSSGPRQALMAIKLFWAGQGQEHWWCPCGEEDRASYIEAFEAAQSWEDIEVTVQELKAQSREEDSGHGQ